MIRRTYKSKKDTLNTIDHKDVLQALDEKNSVFDAFYIQNIKQTKRELSCLGSSNQCFVPSTKVRRRKKYVKRVVKEVDPVIRESITNSIYMTPEKSIHVNKVQDPFDLLLNSSNNQIDPPSYSKVITLAAKDKIKPVREQKTYAQKRAPKTFNCSSSGTDSEKENTVSDANPNVSDIKSHILLIEKDTNLQQNGVDESIIHIIDKMPQLQKHNERNNELNTPKMSFKPNKYRLTKNVNFLSPSCSTPFKEKHRGHSIFKFSPICSEDLRNNSDYLTITEEDKEKELKDQIVFQQSPILQTSKSMKTNLTKYSHKVSLDIETMKNSNIPEIMEMGENSKLEDEVENSINNYTLNKLNLQHSESKPFLGFSHMSIQDIENKNAIKNMEKDLSDNSNVDINNQSVTKNPDDVTSIPGDVEEHIGNNECTELEPFIEFSHNSLDELPKQKKLYNKDSSSQTSSPSSNPPNQAQEVIHSEQEDVKSSDDSTISSDYENAEQTCYDSCDSEQSEDESSDRLFKKHPLIQVERLNSSTFQKYYEVYKHSKNKDTVEQTSSVESDYSSSDSEPCDITKTESNHNLKIEKNIDTQKINSIIISSSGDSVESTSNDEDNCISFVTTRRRNECAKRSSLFMLDDTFTSPGSSGCDKTVINVDNELNLSPVTHNNLDKYQQDLREVMQERKTRLHNNLDKYQQDLKEVMQERKTRLQKFNSSLRKSVMTRKSSNIVRESSTELQEQNRPQFTNAKPGIVLQPGKKWERSLSIYRRMTMTSDHFDHSMVDAGDETFKGRKYRQSVINTMEVQDQSLIHNVSVSSRRSTFVSKPSRSSILIVKKSNISRLSLCESAVFDDTKDDTLFELSKLSIADSEREVTILDQFNDTCREFHESRGPTARDYVLRRCNQTDVILFDECYPEIDLKNCQKIGEGVYGEVYLWRARDGFARVMKIVPIAGTTKVNGETQKDFQEIIAEIVIAMELSALRTPLSEIELYLDEGKDIETLDLHSVGNATDVFNKVLAVRCVYGSYPSRLLDLWELYDEVKGSENDNPAVLPTDQQYLVLELANAGQDLEGYQFNNAEQAHALFWQVAFGIAVGEEAFQFEHRDLHWGNVLIAPTDQKFATFILRGRLYRIPRCGVAATIIDYSLSRLSLDLYNSESASLFNDLATDEALFDAVGDYQFDVYRHMRDKLGNEWKNYEPYTNILWLHYTVDKMITALRYKRTNTKIHKHYIAKLRGIKNRILEYGSATQLVLTDNEN